MLNRRDRECHGLNGSLIGLFSVVKWSLPVGMIDAYGMVDVRRWVVGMIRWLTVKEDIKQIVVSTTKT